MIRRFRHKGLERYFLDDDTRGINAQFAGKLGRQLVVLNRSKTADSMNLPGWKLHPLKGALKGIGPFGYWGNWRLVFAFDGEDATDVDLIDYH